MNIYQQTIPYIYKWVHVPTGKWYIGSKIRKGWNPSRHEEYICSSIEVKPLVINNRSEWVYEILYTGEAEYISKLEKQLLTELDAKNNPMSFNQHNGDGLYNRYGVKENAATRLKKRNARIGDKNPMYGKRKELSPHYGKTYSDEHRQKQSVKLKEYNKNRSESHKKNLSTSLRGNPKLSERMRGENNPMYGIPASNYNKTMTKLKNSGDKNPMKKPEHQRTCEHCYRSIAKNHYTMYHGSNCKNNPNQLDKKI
jgi:hypothetical protein